MEEFFFPVVICAILFIGFPWVIFHYITRWKTAATLTTADENLLDELHDLARRLDDRMGTIERIIQAENPNWRSIARDTDSVGLALEDRSLREFPDSDPEPAVRSNRPRRRNA